MCNDCFIADSAGFCIIIKSGFVKHKNCLAQAISFIFFSKKFQPYKKIHYDIRKKKLYYLYVLKLRLKLSIQQ